MFSAIYNNLAFVIIGIIFVSFGIDRSIARTLIPKTPGVLALHDLVGAMIPALIACAVVKWMRDFKF